MSEDTDRSLNRAAFGRKMRGFRALRAAIVTDARTATPDIEPEMFDADKHLPAMPSGYARYRESAAWKRHEARIRSQRGSNCEDCQRHARVEAFHVSKHRIIPHDDAAVILLCAPCRDKRIPLKPATVKIRTLHEKNNLRQASGLTNLKIVLERPKK